MKRSRTDSAAETHVLVSRLLYMAWGWGGVGLIYGLARRLQAPATVVIPETSLDRLIPFDPVGVWLYLSFFALIPCAFLFADVRRLRWLALSMLSSALVAGCVYVAIPTTLGYTAIIGDSLSKNLLRTLMREDSSQNCLPSLHGALSVLAIWALLPACKERWRGTLLLLWGAGIACAVIQTRRHVALDLACGMLLGGGTGKTVDVLLRRRTASSSRTRRELLTEGASQ